MTPRRRSRLADRRAFSEGAIVLSASWTGALVVDEAMLRAAGGTVRLRRNDTGMSEARTRILHVVEGIRLLWDARRARCLVVCGSMIEVLVVGALRRFVAPRVKIIAFDFLIPDLRGALARPARLLRGFDHIACIRTPDIGILERQAAVDPRRMSFLAFPANPELVDREAADDGYVYSGGNTQRDWATLMAALAKAPETVRTIISTTAPITVPDGMESRVDLIGPVPPAEGRELVRRSSVVVLSHFDTDLAHGPLVLLDAMALGKPVVATATGGTIDYIDDERTGLVVAPGDSDALASALERLTTDPALRERLGRAARAECEQRLAPAEFTRQLLALVERVTDPTTPST
jgi:glycosyltransferase involved in cell wall biosynthesis